MGSIALGLTKYSGKLKKYGEVLLIQGKMTDLKWYDHGAITKSCKIHPQKVPIRTLLYLLYVAIIGKIKNKYLVTTGTELSNPNLKDDNNESIGYWYVDFSLTDKKKVR